MTHTWDGQPAADIDAAWDAMLAAAWWAGRDAAAAKCDAAKDEWLAQSTTYERCHAYAAAAASLAVGISKLTPPPDLAAALAEHTRRAVEAEREAIAAFIETHVYSRSADGAEMRPDKRALDDCHHRSIAAAIRARSTP